ncbi:MAG: hydroxymethylglutaryl-CoA lyase [Candidatus Acidiferrales bacterium]
MNDAVTIVECPRDAWQGLRQVIPTEEKVQYLSRLISLGFRHIDAASFVSPKHVPQMADSEAVMARLSAVKTPTGDAPEIIGIVVNAQGLERAIGTPGVTTVGYPYSISAYFRRANANMSRAESRELVEKLQRDTKAAGRKLVVYISMAFGNPYDEPWGPELVEETLVWLKDLGVRTVSLADTVGTASPEEVAALYQAVKGCVAGVDVGVHLHSRPERAAEKILAAYEAGCRRFDGALTGMGGCPFAGDELVGNIPTEAVLTTLASRGVSTGIDTKSLAVACAMTEELREKYTHTAQAAKPN